MIEVPAEKFLDYSSLLLDNNHFGIEFAANGRTPARLFADDLKNPQFTFFALTHRLYLNGSSEKISVGEFADFLKSTIFPHLRQNSIKSYLMYTKNKQCHAMAKEALPESKEVIRQTFEFDLADRSAVPSYPEDIEAAEINTDLLTRNIKGADDLGMDSVVSKDDDFQKYHFGVVLINKNEIVGRCNSEYYINDRFEIGIWVKEEFRRKGLATNMVYSMLEKAREKGCKTAGWHCYKDNFQSGMTALKAGFKLKSEYYALTGEL